MNQLFPVMLERPEGERIASGLAYFTLAFMIFPFFLLLLMQDSFNDTKILSTLEIIYHSVNFLVATVIFREYLMDSFLVFRTSLKKTFLVVGAAVTLMVTLYFSYGIISVITGNSWLVFSSASCLPLAEVDLFALCCDIVYYSPLWGTLCMVLLAPVATSCLLYATSFAPVCCRRPWLAYLVVAIVVGIPRFCKAFGFWDPMTELVLYLSQLPMHLLACWTYQKTDTIWAPVLTFSASNLLISLLILLSM